MKTILFALFLTLATAAGAQITPLTAEDDFVEANILSVFYHELGHALIDIMALPVFGQEEDAADTASVLFIDDIFKEEAAVGIATDAALGFAAEAELFDGEEPAWWSQHGASLQRFYNLVCLFYGAEPELRDDFAEDMGLPEDRAESCPEEFELASASWGPIFDELYDGTHSNQFRVKGDTHTWLGELVAEEVAALNEEIKLPVEVTVIVDHCGMANGFYDLATKEITICSEFERYFRDLARQIR